VPFDAACAAQILAVKPVSIRARAEVGRFTHA
jgi:hypothetical protein